MDNAAIWSAERGVLGAVAPMLATAVGGPLVGSAASAVCAALGLAPDTPHDQVVAAVLAATPEQLLALKNADATYAAQMRRLDIDAAKLSFDDLANARQRGATMRDTTPAVLAYAITVGFFGLLSLMAFHEMPASNLTVLQIMLGALGAAFGGCVQYYFGSSAGSAQKSALLFQSRPAVGGA